MPPITSKSTMIVKKIIREKDRTLLYGNNPNLHVIALGNEQVEIGDKIKYESIETNFGWYMGKE